MQSYNCLDYNGPAKPETQNFPNYNCPNGLRAQVFFPSCWNGKDLDSKDHKSHMSYPANSYNSGACPPDFPVHLVSIFFEIIWDTGKFADKWYGDSQPFIWSQGDPTGYGGHGDFLMGWDPDHLQDAIDQCTNDSGRVEDCPVFDLIPDKQAEGCRIPSGVDEPVSGILPALPGCNPVQPGPNAEPQPPTCGAPTEISYSGKKDYVDLTSKGWGYMGCGTDNYYNRALTGASQSNDKMTNENCVAFCESKGFSIAGTEYGRECYCKWNSSLISSSILTSPQVVTRYQMEPSQSLESLVTVSCHVLETVINFVAPEVPYPSTPSVLVNAPMLEVVQLLLPSPRPQQRRLSPLLHRLLSHRQRWQPATRSLLPK